MTYIHTATIRDIPASKSPYTLKSLALNLHKFSLKPVFIPTKTQRPWIYKGHADRAELLSEYSHCYIKHLISFPVVLCNKHIEAKDNSLHRLPCDSKNKSNEDIIYISVQKSNC